jgi:NAD(P)-dependent dehydrogenase (short-subunit alcohol dehydrogenase family)
VGSKRLEGKVALVSGAGQRGKVVGTERASAMLFSQAGAKVCLVDWNADSAAETQSIIESDGGTAFVKQADVTKDQDCKTIIESCVKEYGSLDIVLNNVGGPGRGDVTEITEELWEESLDRNLKSAAFVSKYAVPAMAASGGGSIIHVASIDGYRAGAAKNIPYSVAKGGIIQLTRTMAVHHGRDNIRVNCIAPGHLHGPFTEQTPDDWREMRRRAGPLATEGDAWDVAWAEVFLASNESKWISGVILPVDAVLQAATPLSVLHNLV